MQILYQIANAAAGFFYSFVVTYIILTVMEYVRTLRVSESSEEGGIDPSQLGEMAYDYVDLRRDMEVVELEPVSPPIQGEQNGTV
jgi:Amt family ammonium transporter